MQLKGPVHSGCQIKPKCKRIYWSWSAPDFLITRFATFMSLQQFAKVKLPDPIMEKPRSNGAVETPPTSPTKKRHRLFLIERRPLVRDWFLEAIKRESGLALCGSAPDCSDMRAVEALVERAAPDLVVIGMVPAPKTTVEVISRLKAGNKPLSLLCVSVAGDVLEALAVLRAGARGYVSSFDDSKKIWLAVRAVLRGEVHLSEGIALRLVEMLLFPRNGNGDLRVDRLSDRELEVFKFIGKGDMPSEIADKIRLSVKTVENYRSRVMEKLEVKGARELSHLAIEWVSKNSR